MVSIDVLLLLMCVVNVVVGFVAVVSDVTIDFVCVVVVCIVIFVCDAAGCVFGAAVSCVGVKLILVGIEGFVFGAAVGFNCVLIVVGIVIVAFLVLQLVLLVLNRFLM